MTVEGHSVDWQVRTAVLAYAFFSASGNKTIPEMIGKTVTPGQYTPLNGADFVKYLEVADGQVSPMDNAPDIDRILRRMVDEGILGRLPANISMPILSEPLVLLSGVTQAQATGTLWLGSILGPRFLVPTIASVTIPITGLTAKKDENIGTGIALTDTEILTCAHVVKDMTVDDHVTSPAWIAPFSQSHEPKSALIKFPVINISAHPDVDVAVISVDPCAVGLPHVGRPRGSRPGMG